MKKIKNKILHFIQYHNLTLVILMFIIGFGTASLASEEVRDAIFEKQVEEVGVDNTLLLTTDIDSWDFQPEILDIQEDDTYYYVDYQYQTLGIKDNVWQPITKQNTLKFPKQILEEGGRDLSSYVIEEIGEVVLREYQLLKDSQKIAREQGPQKKMKVVKYAGLVGKVLNLKPKVILEETPSLIVEETNFSQEIAQNQTSTEPLGNSLEEEKCTECENAAQESQEEKQIAFLDEQKIREIVEEILREKGLAVAMSGEIANEVMKNSSSQELSQGETQSTQSDENLENAEINTAETSSEGEVIEEETQQTQDAQQEEVETEENNEENIATEEENAGTINTEETDQTEQQLQGEENESEDTSSIEETELLQDENQQEQQQTDQDLETPNNSTSTDETIQQNTDNLEEGGSLEEGDTDNNQESDSQNTDEVDNS